MVNNYYKWILCFGLIIGLSIQCFGATNALNDLVKAAEQGNAKAQCDLGMCYCRGTGVAKDLMKAIELFQKSADQNNPRAQYYLGVCYEEGTDTSKDVTKANELYRKAVGGLSKAAEQGDAEDQRLLGMCFYFGNGVTKDLTKAVEWWKKAAEQGDSQAQGMLGGYYLQGVGVPKDGVEGVKWIRKAAEQGDAQAKYILVMIEGVQVKFDPVDHEIAGFILGEPPSAILKRYTDGKGKLLDSNECKIFNDRSRTCNEEFAMWGIPTSEYIDIEESDPLLKNMPLRGMHISIPPSMLKNELLGHADLYFVQGRLYKVIFLTESDDIATKIFDTLNQKYKGHLIKDFAPSTAMKIGGDEEYYSKSQIFGGDKTVILEHHGNEVRLWYLAYMKCIGDAARAITKQQEEQEKSSQQKKLEKLKDL